MPKPSACPPSKSSRKSSRRVDRTQVSSPPTQTSISLTPPSENTRAKPHFEVVKIMDIDYREGAVKFLVRWKGDDGVESESWSNKRHHTFSDKGNRGTLRTLIESILRANPQRVFHREVSAYLLRSEAKDFEAIRSHVIAEKRRAGERTVYASEEENDDEEEEEDDEGDQKTETGRALIEKKFKKKKSPEEERLTRMRSSSAGNRRYNDMIYDRPSRGPAPRTSHQDRRPNRRPTSTSSVSQSAKSSNKISPKKTPLAKSVTTKTPTKSAAKEKKPVKTPIKKAPADNNTTTSKAAKTPINRYAPKVQTTVQKAPATKKVDKKNQASKSGKNAAKPKK